MPHTLATSYGYATDERGYEGQVRTVTPGIFPGRFVNADTVTLPMGRVIIRKSGTKNGVILPTATGQKPIGVTALKFVEELSGYPVLRPVWTIKQGSILMIPEVDVTAGDPVYFRHTANTVPGTHEAIGRLRNNADTAKADLLSNFAWEEDGKAGQLTYVYVHLI